MPGWLPKFISSTDLDPKLQKPTTYLTALLGCLISISNLKCSKPDYWSTPENCSIPVFFFLVNGNPSFQLLKSELSGSPLILLLLSHTPIQAICKSYRLHLLNMLRHSHPFSLPLPLPPCPSTMVSSQDHCNDVLTGLSLLPSLFSSLFSTQLLGVFLLLFLFSFWPCAACGILVPQPGIEPMPLAVVAWVLTTGSPGKSLPGCLSKVSQILSFFSSKPSPLHSEWKLKSLLWPTGLLHLIWLWLPCDLMSYHPLLIRSALSAPTALPGTALHIPTSGPLHLLFLLSECSFPPYQHSLLSHFIHVSVKCHHSLGGAFSCPSIWNSMLHCSLSSYPELFSSLHLS